MTHAIIPIPQQYFTKHNPRTITTSKVLLVNGIFNSNVYIVVIVVIISAGMNNFFDRFKPGGGKTGKGSSSSTNNNNPLAGIFGGSTTTSFSGTGQSLGGNVKPGKVISITLSEAGPLGVKIERSSTDTAIVSMVVPNTQADAVGIQRGDILCFAETNGTEEINYNMFLELAKSDQRPLCFEIRRIVAPSTTSKKGSTSNINASTQLSAEAFARKQAMIAAAEKREKDHQKKYNSNTNSNKSSSTAKPALKQILSTADKNRLEQERQQRVLEQQLSSENNHSEFVQRAKDLEQQTASQLGYNPYVTQSVSAGLARNVVTAATTTHGGTIQNTTSTNNTAPISSPNTPSPGNVASPPSLPAAAERTTTTNRAQQQQLLRPSIEFQQAFEMTVTSTPDHTAVINSITILRKLIINATTKGQSSNDDKFRKIRFMTNPKIRSAVTDIPGAIDLLLSIGFQIHEDHDSIIIMDDNDHDDTTMTNQNNSTNESVLLYPPATPGPAWLPTALQLMEQYIDNDKNSKTRTDML